MGIREGSLLAIALVSGGCNDGFDANLDASAARCAEGLTSCGHACVDTRSDVANCGGCGRSCCDTHATPVCLDSLCAITACAPGFADCNGWAGDGCEVDLGGDDDNCGACGNRCDSDEHCVGGSCVSCVDGGPPPDLAQACDLATPPDLSPTCHGRPNLASPDGPTVPLGAPPCR